MGTDNRILNASNASITVTNLTGAGDTLSIPFVPVTTADLSATGQLCLPVRIVGSSASIVVQTNQTGATSIASGQVLVGNTDTAVVSARANRRSATVKNQSTSVTVYVGTAGVTTATGIELKPGESINIDSISIIDAITASGSATVGYIETYG